MTAIEQFEAAGKILAYARSLGFTESMVEVDDPAMTFGYVECESLEKILEWAGATPESLNPGEGEWMYLKLNLNAPTTLEYHRVDVMEEEMAKMEPKERERLIARLNSEDPNDSYKALDSVENYSAVRFLPGGEESTVKWPDNRDEPVIVPPRLEQAWKGLLPLERKS
jgi:hypothetical protein